jgi:hypothetical protein
MFASWEAKMGAPCCIAGPETESVTHGLNEMYVYQCLLGLLSCYLGIELRGGVQACIWLYKFVYMMHGPIFCVQGERGLKIKKNNLAATMFRWCEGGVNLGLLSMTISEEESNLFCACHLLNCDDGQGQ